MMCEVDGSKDLPIEEALLLLIIVLTLRGETFVGKNLSLREMNFKGQLDEN